MVEIPLTRASLLVRLRDPRDQTAWQEFIDLYAPLVYRYARRQGLQDADAADLGQEVFSTVARAVGTLEYDPQRGAFRNWLLKIVWRKLANWRALRGNRLRGCGDTAAQLLLEAQSETVSNEAEWEAQWQERVFGWACEQVRGQVSAATWQAFWKTAVERRPGKQVAQELGMTVLAVYRARSRVMARLKELARRVQEQES